MSLVVTRKKNESVYIDRVIKVTIVEAGSGKVKLAIDAPESIQILRDELLNMNSFTDQETELN